ncbi:unnamed protein product, partial [Closterium sp. Naga37s-1]
EQDTHSEQRCQTGILTSDGQARPALHMVDPAPHIVELEVVSGGDEPDDDIPPLVEPEEASRVVWSIPLPIPQSSRRPWPFLFVSMGDIAVSVGSSPRFQWPVYLTCVNVPLHQTDLSLWRQVRDRLLRFHASVATRSNRADLDRRHAQIYDDLRLVAL